MFYINKSVLEALKKLDAERLKLKKEIREEMEEQQDDNSK